MLLIVLSTQWNFKMTETINMTEATTVSKPKHKGGRPRKDKTGKHMWIPAQYVDVVKAILDAGKKQK